MQKTQSYSDIQIPAIWQLTPYEYRWRKEKCKYPTFRLWQSAHKFFLTKEEAIEAVRNYADRYAPALDPTYCLSLREFPSGTSLWHEMESFSEQLYLPDGTFWSERPYADIIPHEIPPQYSEIEYDNYLYGKCAFYGRRPEEIRFHKGDTIEIFCYEGNHCWSDGYVDLAIVVDTPPTIDEMTSRIRTYLNDDSSLLTGDIGFDIGTHFNHHHDVYTVIPAYHSLKENPREIIDFCPTHCAFPPHQKVSARMRNKLLKQLERVSEKDVLKFKER